jgi:hypothetical protein
MQDGKRGAESVPLSDTEVVAVSTGPKLVLSTQPSPLSKGVSCPSASMSDVGLGTALASPGSRNVPDARCEGLGPILPGYFECSLPLVVVAGIPSVRALYATESKKNHLATKLATGRARRLTAMAPCHSFPPLDLHRRPPLFSQYSSLRLLGVWPRGL